MIYSCGKRNSHFVLFAILCLLHLCDLKVERRVSVVYCSFLTTATRIQGLCSCWGRMLADAPSPKIATVEAIIADTEEKPVEPNVRLSMPLEVHRNRRLI